MSILGIMDAMRSDLPPAHRLVWQCLESRSNKTRSMLATVDSIAEELRLSRPTVMTALASLEDEGIIRRNIRPRRPTIISMLRHYRMAAE